VSVRDLKIRAGGMIESGDLTESLLIISGSMGAGKTTVLAEASDLLALRHIVHATIDLDALGIAHLPAASSSDGLRYDNLQSVCQNYAAHGVKRLLLARALEGRSELQRCLRCVSSASAIVCRLTASIETMQQRVRIREAGVFQREFVVRVEKLNDILDRAQLEDFSISSENRSPTDVADEMLVKAGWIAN
jgi:hypothetical protein